MKTLVSSNQWSNDIWAGSGSHTIRAVVPEMSDSSDSYVKYRSSSNSMPYTVQATSSSSGVQSDETFPIEYVILAIVIAVGVGIALAFSKRKKTTPKVTASVTTQRTQQDDTQFWVCPHCGRDTEYKNGKQFCSSCNVYL